MLPKIIILICSQQSRLDLSSTRFRTPLNLAQDGFGWFLVVLDGVCCILRKLKPLGDAPAFMLVALFLSRLNDLLDSFLMLFVYNGRVTEN